MIKEIYQYVLFMFEVVRQAFAIFKIRLPSDHCFDQPLSFIYNS